MNRRLVLPYTLDQYRIATLAALGYETAIIQMRDFALGGLLLRQCASYWPIVCNGWLTATEATRIFDHMLIFDRMLKAQQPPAADAWLRNCGTDAIGSTALGTETSPP